MFAAAVPLLAAVALPAWGSGWFIFGIFAVFLALAAVAGYFHYRKEKQRTEALRQVAEELRFDFSARDDGGLLNALKRDNFHLLSQGSSKQCYNVLRGRASNLEVTIFDYNYTISSGKSSSTWRQTVLAFRLPGPSLPAFSLRPENVWHKIGHLFGYQDINFDEHPTFSSRYLLRGPDEAAVREVFTDPVLSFYEGVHGVSTEANGDRLLFYRHNQRVKPEQVRSFLEEGFKILAVFRPPVGEGAEASPDAE